MKNLIGNMVLIHPDLTVDPAGKQGQIGMIAGADIESDTIVVSFGNTKLGSYASDALMVLKEPGEIYKKAMSNVLNMDVNTFKNLLMITMEQESGQLSRMVKAFEIASKDEAVREWSMISLEDKLLISQGRMEQQQAQMELDR